MDPRIGPAHGGTSSRPAGAALPPLADVFDVIPEPAVLCDGQWRVRYENPAAEAVFGALGGSVGRIGRVLWEAVPALNERVREAAERVLADGVPADVQIRDRRADRWWEIHLTPAAGGVLGYGRDVTKRHRATEELRRSEALFHQLADHAPVLIWLADADNRGTYFNRRWLEFTGRPLGAELGAGWLEGVHPEDRSRVESVCGGAFARRDEFRLEFRLRRADGTYRWILDHGVPRRDGEGSFIGYIGSCVDITERREAEATSARLLREAEQARADAEHARAQLDTILESMTDGFVSYDPDWRLVYANRRARALLAEAGVAGEPVGRVLWEMLPRLVGSDIERSMKHAAAAREPVSFEVPSTGGGWTSVRVYPGAEGVSAFWADVTARRREEERRDALDELARGIAGALDPLRIAEALAGVVAQRLADRCAVWAADETGRFTKLADRTRPPADPAGGDLEPARRDALAALVDAAGRALRLDEARPVFRAGGAGGPWDARALDGRVIVLAARGTPIGIVLAGVTPPKRFEDADLKLLEELSDRACTALDNAMLFRASEHANQVKARFLATISHELRTPLSAIIGYEAILSEGIPGPVNDGQRTHLGRIRASADHLLRLIEEVLVFARVEAGRETARAEDVEIAPLLAEAEAIVRPLADAHGLTLDVRHAAEPVRIRTDRSKLLQILINLLGNAIRHTDSGTVTLGCETVGGRLDLHVADTGVGIPAEHLDRIFDAFWQGSSATHRRGGTGLGLSVARMLAELLGGRIDVVSREGAGSTFTVRLPFVPPSDT